MLRISVIALSINNLTDARYFAALGVDWLGFNINPASENYVNPAQLKQIIDWVEGPKMLIQEAQWNPDAISLINSDELKISGQLLQDSEQAIQKDNFAIFSAVEENQESYRLVSSLADWQESKVPASESYILYSGNIEDLSDQLNLDETPGLVLFGSSEEAAGVKSFEDLDDVFELLYP